MEGNLGNCKSESPNCQTESIANGFVYIPAGVLPGAVEDAEGHFGGSRGAEPDGWNVVRVQQEGYPHPRCARGAASRYVPARTTPVCSHICAPRSSLEPELTPASPDPAPRVSQPRTPRHAREHAPTPPGEWVTGRRGTRPVPSPTLTRAMWPPAPATGMLTPTFDDRFNTPEGWLTGPADFAGISGGPRSVAQPVRAPAPPALPLNRAPRRSSRRVDSSLRQKLLTPARAAGSFAFGRYRSGLTTTRGPTWVRRPSRRLAGPTGRADTWRRGRRRSFEDGPRLASLQTPRASTGFSPRPT